MPEFCDTNLCPAKIARELIGGKWKLEILWHLYPRTRRFGELQKLLPGIARGVLTTQLRELEQSGLVYREVFKEVPPRVEYSLTEIGRGFMPIFKAIGEWGRTQAKNARQGAVSPSSGKISDK